MSAKNYILIYKTLLLMGVVILSARIFPPISLSYSHEPVNFLCQQYAVGLSFGFVFSVILQDSIFYWIGVAVSLFMLGVLKDLSFLHSTILATLEIMLLLGSKYIYNQFSHFVSNRFARKIMSKLTVATGASIASAIVNGLYFQYVQYSSVSLNWNDVVTVALANFLGIVLIIPVFEYFTQESRLQFETKPLRSSLSQIFLFSLSAMLILAMVSYAESVFVLMPIVLAFFVVAVEREGNAIGALFLSASFVFIVLNLYVRREEVLPSQMNEIYLLYMFLALFQILLVSIRSDVVYEKVQAVLFVVSVVMCVWGLLEVKHYEQEDLNSAKDTMARVESILEKDFNIVRHFFQHFDEQVDVNQLLKNPESEKWNSIIESFYLNKALNYVTGVGIIQKSKALPQSQFDQGFSGKDFQLWDRLSHKVIYHYPPLSRSQVMNSDVSESHSIMMALHKLSGDELSVLSGQDESMIIYRSKTSNNVWYYMLFDPKRMMSDRAFYDEREINIVPSMEDEPVRLSRYVSSLKSPVGIEGKIELGQQTLRAWTSVEGRNHSIQQRSFIMQSLGLLIVLSILGVGFVTFEWFVDRDLLLEKVQSERDTFEVQATEQKLISQSLREMTVGAVHDVNGRLAVLRGRTTVIKKQIERKQIKIEDLPSQLETINDSVEGINKVMVGVRSLIWQSGGDDDFKIFTVAELIESLQTVSFERFKNHGIDFKIDVIFGEMLSDVKISGRMADLTKLFVHIFSEMHDIVIQRPNSWIKLEVMPFPKQIQFKIVASRWIEELSTESEEEFIVQLGKKPNMVSAAGIAKVHEGTLDINSESRHLRVTIILPRAWS